MKTQVRMISIALAATAAISGSLLAAPLEARASDGQAQAAALLNRDWTPVAADTHRMVAMSTSRVDAQIQAAALLARPQTGGVAVPMSRLSQAMPVDGQARAAALLSSHRAM